MSCNWSTIRVGLLVLIIVTSLSGAPAFAQGSAAVRVDPSSSSVQVNDSATIAIRVDGAAGLTAFEIHLSFDPNVLEVTGLTNGGFVAADFVAQNIFDNTAGTIDYAVAQMNRTPAQGSGSLLNIGFRAKAAGTATVTTRPTPAAPGGLLLSDQNGNSISASWTPGTINVGSSITPTYTPTNTLAPTSTPTPTNTSSSLTPGTGTPSSTPTPTNTTSSITPGTGTPSSTPTPTRTPTLTPTPSGTAGTHIVRWGEWVYCIARAYRVSPTAIIQANRLWWPYIIFPNQKLTIPNVPWTNMTAGPVCQAQFTFPAPTPTPTATAVTPAVTNTSVTNPPPPSSTPIPATTAPPPACRAYYVVRWGDTLYNIARRYGTTYMEIARLNGISNPRLIYPGQQLCIP